MPKDALAGLTVWALLVPQALAYGQLAGLPVVHGLYAALGALALPTDQAVSERIRPARPGIADHRLLHGQSA